jgi:serine/threonine protein kinase
MEDKFTIGRYEIVSEVRTESDQDSIKTVYKAKDLYIKRLSMLRATRFLDGCENCKAQKIRGRYLREALVTRRLSHEGVVSVFDVAEKGDTIYLAMEWLKGESLERHIEKGSLLPLHQLLHIVAKIADVLDYIHAKGVVHRNLKPANIMISGDGTVKITGFGLAQMSTNPKPKVRALLGTPNYMSPEQAMGLQTDGRSDIFSLGVILFRLLTGEPPFRGRDLRSLLYQITKERHSAVSSIDPEIPPVVERIVDKALAKDPGGRYQMAREIAEDIRLAKKTFG